MKHHESGEDVREILRGGLSLPAGATLGMGFEADGVHGRVLRHVNETVTVEPLDEVMHIHLDDAPSSTIKTGTVF